MSAVKFRRKRISVAVLAALLPAAGYAVSPLGSEFRVNTTTDGVQELPATAIDDTGDFVIVWQDSMGAHDSDSISVRSSRQNFNRSSISEVGVNSYTTSVQYFPDVASDADGDHLVVWNSAQDGDGFGVYGQQFTAAGATSGAEFLINTYTTGSQNAPAVAMDADGDAVVVWHSPNEDGNSLGVFAARVTGKGSSAGAAFQVNTYTSGPQGNADVAIDADGDFVVVWQSYGQAFASSNFDIYGQRFSAGGTPQGDEFLVNTYTDGVERLPSVAMDDTGDFVVAWERYGGSGNDGVFAQRFNAAGTPQGSEIVVESATAKGNSTPSVAMDAGGDFVIAYDGFTGQQILASVYRADGTELSSGIVVNTYTTGSQSNPAVAANSDGDFVISWTSVGQDGPGEAGVYAQRFQAKRVVGDHNSDGMSDILWRYSTLGWNSIWRMNGLSATFSNIPTVGSTSWQIVGIGDFNSNSYADILWRHTSGQNSIWQLGAALAVTFHSISSVSDTSWNVVGTGDFNADGVDDILWRNASTGQNSIWLENGSFGATFALIPQISDTNWKVAGVGDLNFDGKADIVWRNTATGANAAWLMDGTTATFGSLLTVSDTNWQIVGIGDFDGNTSADILFRHATGGQNAIWFMDGFTASTTNIPSVSSTSWRVERVGDYNGDGNADILWRNSSNGQNSIWHMNGTTPTFGSIATVSDTSWEIKPD